VGFQKLATEGGGTGGAVAFADEELGGGPAGILGDVEADEFGDAAGVLVEAVEVLGFIRFGGATVAGADGVDEDEVGLVEQGGFVVDLIVGRREGEAVVLEFDAFGAEQAHVHPDRGRAGAAVEGEGEGALGRFGGIGLFFDVGDVEDLGRDFAFGVFERKGACGGGVVDLLAVEGDAVLGGSRSGRLDFVFSRFVLGLLSGLFVGCVRSGLGLLAEQGKRQCEDECGRRERSKHGAMIGGNAAA
jgi:hypothetical protein